MSSSGAAAPGTPLLASSARAQASRINGARSRGARTPEGKVLSSQNALKHGLRAQTYVLLHDEDAAEYEALEAALTLELAPEGVLQTVLARRIARAAWRLARADRIEVELFERAGGADGDLGLALIRDGNGARAFPTLLRYRGAAQAELWRALRMLKALQAEQHQAPTPVREAEGAPALAPARTAPAQERSGESLDGSGETGSGENPNGPEPRADPGEFEPARLRSSDPRQKSPAFGLRPAEVAPGAGAGVS